MSLDITLITPRGRGLAALLSRVDDFEGRERWALPWDAPRKNETLDAAALRVSRGVIGVAPALLEQAGAVADDRRHPGNAEVSVGYFGLVPESQATASMDQRCLWWPLAELPAIPPRHRVLLDRARETLRSRLDRAPIAFRLLPATFTLGELQEIYEILLGKALHKASFRRSLQAAALVEPTDEWRSEGRGRPARLFRYASNHRPGTHRGVRFDFLAG
ncbi:MAG: NUDIX domain-containing protein [Gemmatimonadaceae bacterium]